MIRRILAVMLVAFVAAPLSAQRVLGDGIRELAEQVSGGVSKQKKTRIAVIPFRELDGNVTVLGTFVAEELVTHLFMVGGLEIVERGLLDKVLREQKLQQTGAIDPDTAREVGRVAGVEAIVSGTITDFQSYVAINCRLIDTQTGRVFGAAQTKIVKDDDVKKVMATAAPAAPAPSPKKTAPATAPASKSWMERTVRGSLDRAKRVSVYSTPGVNLTLAYETTTEEPQDFRAAQYYLLDETGDRWNYYGDDRHFVGNGVTLLPQARARSTFTFTCNAGACNGTKFSLVNPDTKKILLRDIDVP